MRLVRLSYNLTEVEVVALQFVMLPLVWVLPFGVGFVCTGVDE